MAKENFDRSKPHVNVAASTTTITDTAGELSLEAVSSDTLGASLTLSAPPSALGEVVIVGYPFDEIFRIEPTRERPVLSIDYQLDVLPLAIVATDPLEVSFAIRQDQQYFLSAARHVYGDWGSWRPVADAGLTADDFVALGGGPGRPDFGQAFHFGFALTGQYAEEGLYVEVGLDNLHVEITSVPEPSSFVLVAALGASLGASLLWQRWWRG